MCAAIEHRPLGGMGQTGHARPAFTRGLSLVELMVGLVVGLLVSLAAGGSAQLFNATQRQGLGVGSGSVNAASALAAIKGDVANVGLGFFGDSKYGCASLNLSTGITLRSNGAVFSPVQATRSGANDVLDIVYGSEVSAGAAVPLALSSTGSDATLASLLPATVGQAVLLAPLDGVSSCTVRSVTATTVPTAADKQLLSFGAAGSHNQVAFTTPVTYPAKSLAALLGTLQWNRYSVASGNLVITRVLDGSTAILLRNVIALRIEYGTSAAAAGSTTLDAWQDPSDVGWTAIGSGNIARVRALRIGIVVRSAQREKANASGTCEASSAKPVLFSNTIEPDVTDWRCYRYRSAVIVAPLRNVVYGLK